MMIEMKALILEISFFEAFFKVHHTKGFKLTYPIPLPTTVAGIFGAMLGIERGKLKKEFNEILFGAKLIKYESIIQENVSFVQYKSGKVEKGVTPVTIINEPTYFIVAAGEENKIKEILTKIKYPYYLPYGGQNDFFVKDWKVVEICDVIKSDEITNYAPQDMIKNLILRKNTEIQILPVRHKISKDSNFYFVINGGLKLKEKIFCTEKENIGLYSLEKFEMV